MKFRTGFVTNSSSSSFLCISKVKMCEELQKYMKEEYGNFGTRLLKEYVQKGSDVLADKYGDIRCYLEDMEDEDGSPFEIKENDYYLSARFLLSTTEGDTNGDDAFLYEAIPDKYMEEIYNERE